MEALAIVRDAEFGEAAKVHRPVTGSPNNSTPGHWLRDMHSHIRDYRLAAEGMSAVNNSCTVLHCTINVHSTVYTVAAGMNTMPMCFLLRVYTHASATVCPHALSFSGNGVTPDLLEPSWSLAEVSVE